MNKSIIYVCILTINLSINSYGYAGNSTRYYVDYYHKLTGLKGKGTRARLSGSTGQHLYGGISESAVLSYLKRKHKGEEIIIMRLKFR